MQKKIKTAFVTTLDEEGDGLGYFLAGDGEKREVAVPFTAPSDEVEIEVGKKRRGVFESRLLNVVKPSPERHEARCIHFGVCGGCRLQHLSYERQLQFKEGLIKKWFSPLAEVGCFKPILPCTPPWEYRNKMEWTFSQDKKGERFLGLIQRAGRGKVLNVQICHLVRPWFIQALETARSWWLETGLDAYHPHKNSGSLRTLTVREGMRTGDRLVMLTVSGNPEYALKKQDIETFCQKMNGLKPEKGDLSVFLRIHQAIKGQPTEFYEMHLSGPDTYRERIGSTEFKISPSAFFQPNTAQAEVLYETALSYLNVPHGKLDGKIIYDLYCGTGTLGITMAPSAKQVIGIELSPESSLDARMNAKANGLTNVKIITGDVGTCLEKAGQDFPLPDIVVVDPPRAGLSPEAIRHILALKPEEILYIACNPKTQSQNCQEFLKEGYQIGVIQPVDQFPHTPHIENIVVLSRPNPLK